jgi:hypothetical protein
LVLDVDVVPEEDELELPQAATAIVRMAAAARAFTVL